MLLLILSRQNVLLDVRVEVLVMIVVLLVGLLVKIRVGRILMVVRLLLLPLHRVWHDDWGWLLVTVVWIVMLWIHGLLITRKLTEGVCDA